MKQLERRYGRSEFQVSSLRFKVTLAITRLNLKLETFLMLLVFLLPGVNCDQTDTRFFKTVVIDII